MNYHWDKKYLYWGVTAFCVIAGSLLFYTCLTNMAGVLSLGGRIIGIFMPVIYGFALAYLLSPVMNYFEKRLFRVLFGKIESRRVKHGKTRTAEEAKAHDFRVKRISRVLGVTATVVVALACIVGLISAVLPQLVTSVRNLIDNTNTYIKTIREWDLAFLNGLPEVKSAVSDFLQDAPAQITKWLQDNVLPQMTDIAGTVTSGIWTTLGALLNIILGLVISVYLLYGKELFSAQIKKTLYSVFSVSNANLIIRNMRSIHKKFGGFITGKLIDSLIIGALCFIILTIFGIPYAVLISFIVSITNIIPYFGPIIGAVPCALLILWVDPVKCLEFLIIILVLQQFDGNILGPYILGDNTGLSSFWIIFALILGQSLFGFVGLVIGIPIFSFIYAVTKTKITRRLVKRGFPSDSNFYRSVSHIEKETGEFVFLEESDKRRRRKAGKEKDGKSS